VLEKVAVVYLLPLVTCLLILFIKGEKRITQVSFVANLLVFMHTIFLIGYFVFAKQSFQEIHLGELAYEREHFEFDFLFDELAVLFSFIIGFLSLVVIKFSSYYLHREIGFKRFFFTINLFIFGLYLLSMAGTLDLFFAGWEIVGLSSFLLIGFYHERTRPVRNAFRVFTIYRICDFGLLMSAILIHLYLKSYNHFYAMEHIESLPDLTLVKTILPLLLVFASIGKSAQFPFVNWPARAMEGPTPSSAIFYGGLSIHCGVVLLLRTYPLFESNNIILGVIFTIGLLSFIYGRRIGKVQSNIKGQLAYSAVSQIGLMYIEIALGLITLVYIHLFCHAILRCYQILVSPSIVADYVFNQDQESESIPLNRNLKLSTTFFSFGIQEGLISITERGFFPFPMIMIKIYFKKYWKYLVALPLFAYILFYFVFTTRLVAFNYREFAAHIIGSLDLGLCLYCLISNDPPRKIWNIFFLSMISFISSNLIFSEHAGAGVLLYTLGAAPCWILGYVALRKIPPVPLYRYNGLYSQYTREYYLFLLAFIGLAGYPFTTIFWAEDVLFGELLTEAPLLLVFTALSMVLNGFIGARLLVKIFWGFPSYTKV